MYRLSLTSAPSVEPVTTDEVKTYLRIDSSDEDTLLDNLVIAARQQAEAYTGRAFITQTYTMYMNAWPSYSKDKWWDGVRQGAISELTGNSDIIVPRAPLQSITSIKTYDDDDNETTFNSSNYYVSTYAGSYADSGRVVLRNGASAPLPTRTADGLEVIFVAGYGDAASDVPQQIKQAILQIVSYLYNNREACDEGCLSCGVAKMMLNPFKLMNI